LTDGILISPNYPNHYDHNGDCVWVISIPVNERIALNFTDFVMESSATCAFDYIEVKTLSIPHSFTKFSFRIF
jgi:cubilin